ncbi:5-methyltetrahydropteroyltriglutamate--homocysteine methyltransferase [Parasphingorhabdus marina DSM 22363]|uniref:5-methyltetrahydropteroyltriglutamate--homocysteine methyltransferase n=1 Tax=Parasphingorhabdus marina DSM 22363 TaxID=1123272 RepID=A0A1N6D398_9SPHN|nr:cobalamin-independent methionine synthase II family protein [Parasphingorhabdus marina]SIN65271.1 5-methyltetrahydropteroyltriglutamate--homocysteine methyltransferase [Parasphingorhabdus marina DSM 22363]
MGTEIKTTHVGSLPRSKAVTDLVFAVEKGEAVDLGRFSDVIGEAVEETVRKQVEAGISIVSDGEMSKISYATYIKDRITGFDGDSERRPPADLEQFPGFLERQAKSGGTPTYRRPKCVGEIRVKSMEPLEDDLRRFQSAIEVHKPQGVFMNAASPGVIALFQPNEYYADDDAYLEALAEAMRAEYEAIVSDGLFLQLDSPDLGLGRHMMYKDRSDEEYLQRIGRHVDMLNHALRNVPAEKVRMHVCWGNYEGPHHCDVEMGVILPTLMKAKPAALLFETANPRHAHDWATFAEMADQIPDNKILIPGVIDSTTNFVEHPKAVAERISRFVNLFGAERVIAGTDCGFSTFAGFGAVDPDIVWLKLKTLADGAELASKGGVRVAA